MQQGGWPQGPYGQGPAWPQGPTTPFGYGARGGPICSRCGGGATDHFTPGFGTVHRHCVGLGPDELTWPWIVLAYAVTIPFGCSFIGALIASIPYYLWKKDYPLRASRYNRHVWIGFALSCAMWIAIRASTRP